MLTILGVLVGGFIAICSTFVYDNYKEFKTKKRIALAINHEINSIHKLAKDNKWTEFLEGDPGIIENVKLPISYNYFTVYESNAGLISLLDSDLAENIIDLYNKTKSLLEEIKQWNNLVELRSKNRIDLETIKNIRVLMSKKYADFKTKSETINSLVNIQLNKKFIYVFN